MTTPTLADHERSGVIGSDWVRSTHWAGDLDDDEIAAIERRYSVRFTPDHRLFLKVLHATKPLMQAADFFRDGARQTLRPVPGFYSWLRDEDAIREMLDWPAHGLAWDAENNALWPASWGLRPDTAIERRARIDELIAAAPRLVPIFSHRYVVGHEPSLVLSVHHSDIIVYGNDLRDYLLRELSDVLDLDQALFPKSADARSIPFWGELIG